MVCPPLPAEIIELVFHFVDWGTTVTAAPTSKAFARAAQRARASLRNPFRPPADSLSVILTGPALAFHPVLALLPLEDEELVHSSLAIHEQAKAQVAGDVNLLLSDFASQPATSSAWIYHRGTGRIHPLSNPTGVRVLDVVKTVPGFIWWENDEEEAILNRHGRCRPLWSGFDEVRVTSEDLLNTEDRVSPDGGPIEVWLLAAMCDKGHDDWVEPDDVGEYNLLAEINSIWYPSVPAPAVPPYVVAMALPSPSRPYANSAVPQSPSLAGSRTATTSTQHAAHSARNVRVSSVDSLDVARSRPRLRSSSSPPSSPGAAGRRAIGEPRPSTGAARRTLVLSSSPSQPSSPLSHAHPIQRGGAPATSPADAAGSSSHVNQANSSPERVYDDSEAE